MVKHEEQVMRADCDRDRQGDDRGDEQRPDQADQWLRIAALTVSISSSASSDIASQAAVMRSFSSSFRSAFGPSFARPEIVGFTFALCSGLAASSVRTSSTSSQENASTCLNPFVATRRRGDWLGARRNRHGARRPWAAVAHERKQGADRLAPAGDAQPDVGLGQVFLDRLGRQAYLERDLLVLEVAEQEDHALALARGEARERIGAGLIRGREHRERLKL